MTWTTKGTDVTFDPETNQPIPGEPGVTLSIPARYAPVQSKEIKNQDNVTVLQKGKVFVPKGGECPEIGNTVRVEPDMFSGEVLDVYKGQLGWEVVV